MKSVKTVIKDLFKIIHNDVDDRTDGIVIDEIIDYLNDLNAEAHA